MKEEFVRSDKELLDVLQSAQKHELELLVATLRKAASCYMDKSCQDPLLIADEFQKLGGNTIANKTRGHGVLYREIVTDVAKKIKTRIEDNSDIARIEWQICEHVLKNAHEILKKKEKEEFENQLRKVLGSSFDRDIWDTIKTSKEHRNLKYELTGLLIIDQAKRINADLASSIPSTVTCLAAGAGFTFGGPIGIAVGAAVGIVLGTILKGFLYAPGPAYKATIPAVFIIAWIRLRILNKPLPCPRCGFVYKYDGKHCGHCGNKDQHPKPAIKISVPSDQQSKTEVVPNQYEVGMFVIHPAKPELGIGRITEVTNFISISFKDDPQKEIRRFIHTAPLQIVRQSDMDIINSDSENNTAKECGHPSQHIEPQSFLLKTETCPACGTPKTFNGFECSQCRYKKVPNTLSLQNSTTQNFINTSDEALWHEGQKAIDRGNPQELVSVFNNPILEKDYFLTMVLDYIKTRENGYMIMRPFLKYVAENYDTPNNDANRMDLWNAFCKTYKIKSEGVSLFDQNALIVSTFALGDRMLLKRSNKMEQLIRKERSIVVDDYNKKESTYDGLIYMMYWVKDDQIIPLYIGKADKYGENENLVSANFTSDSFFCRWGYAYDYHMGNLSAVVCPGHLVTKKKQNYINWGNCLFEACPSNNPKLKEEVYFWCHAWNPENEGLGKKMNAGPLILLEAFLIRTAKSLFPDILLNVEYAR